jgi:AcrR family transcriptional regulator
VVAEEPVGPAPARSMRADARRNRARILAVAEEVFAEQGASASTEEVAARAGVAIGTVFRHFPTKKDLLAEIVKEFMQRLADEVNVLVAEGEPATALFEFFTKIVRQAAAKKTVVDLLAEAGVTLEVGKPLRAFGQAIDSLLVAAQRAGAVRDDVALAEVVALLTATSQGALRSGWDEELQRRTLAIVFAGLKRN